MGMDHEQTVHTLSLEGDGRMLYLVVRQGTVDGLQALLAWLEGFEAGGHGRVPGHFELTMFIRQIVSTAQSQGVQ